jgi:murein L,D-transpeptidase YafK
MKKIWILLTLVVVLIVFSYYNLRLENPLPANTVIDKLVINKSKRELQAYSNGKLLKTYTVSLGGNPVGHKEYEGDSKTPEGRYIINDKNPNSGYHKNLGVSYPNEKDIAYAKSIGKSAGGDIKIHGLRNYKWFIGKIHRQWDWTAGCIAVTDQEIDELYRFVKVGIPIEINP